MEASKNRGAAYFQIHQEPMLQLKREMALHRKIRNYLKDSQPYPSPLGYFALSTDVPIEYYRNKNQDTLRQQEAAGDEGRHICNVKYIHLSISEASGTAITLISADVEASMNQTVKYTVVVELVTCDKYVLGINDVTCLIPKEIKVSMTKFEKEKVEKRVPRVCTNRQSRMHGRALLEYLRIKGLPASSTEGK